MIPPPLPRYAVVLSLTIAKETAGLIDTLPAEPALSSVSMSWWKSAEIVNLPPPVNVALFSIAARMIWALRTWIAAEAPMPTLPLFASESALAVSSSLLCALSVTSPPSA